MNKEMKEYVALCFAVLICSGCATSKKSILTGMAVSGLVGATTGYQSSPAGENKTAHAALWGAVAAAAAAAVGLYVFDEEKETDRLRLENRALADQIEKGSSQKEVEFEKNSKFIPDEFPQEFSSLIKPGNFRVYKIDRWEREGNNRLVYKSKMVELDPPKLKGQ